MHPFCCLRASVGQYILEYITLATNKSHCQSCWKNLWKQTKGGLYLFHPPHNQGIYQLVMGTVASSWFQPIACFCLLCLFACLAAFPLSCLSLSHKHPQISHAEITCSLLLLHKCTQIQQGVCHTVALPFTLKSILRQKKNYGNSNISPCKNIPIFKTSLYKKPKSFKIS